MSTYSVRLDYVQVTEGQGVSEGDFELRVNVQESDHQIVWPSPTTWTKIDNGGAKYTVNREVAKYTVNSGSQTKIFSVDLTEVDGGVNGQDDYGHGTVSFVLQPGMQPVPKAISIPLKRPNGKFQGTVKVGLIAQPA